MKGKIVERRVEARKERGLETCDAAESCQCILGESSDCTYIVYLITSRYYLPLKVTTQERENITYHLTNSATMRSTVFCF